MDEKEEKNECRDVPVLEQVALEGHNLGRSCPAACQ